MSWKTVFPNRIGRLEFGTWLVFTLVCCMAVCFVAVQLSRGFPLAMAALAIIYFFPPIVLIPPRMRDCGWSGSASFLGFVPTVNVILIILLLILKDSEPNRYGPAPKRRTVFTALSRPADSPESFIAQPTPAISSAKRGL